MLSWFVRCWIYLVSPKKKNLCQVNKQSHENEKYCQEMEESGCYKGQTDRKTNFAKSQHWTHSVCTNRSFENILPPFSYCIKSVCESSLVLDLTVGLWPLSLSAQGRCFCYIIAWGQHLPSLLVKQFKAGELTWTQEAPAFLMYTRTVLLIFGCVIIEKYLIKRTYSTIQYLITNMYILRLFFPPIKYMNT